MNELKQQNNAQSSFSKPTSIEYQEESNSICSPLLVSSISQLLYNLSVLLPEEAILMSNNSGIMNLLISYVKPINLLNKESSYSMNNKDWHMNEEIIDMLYMICRYLNLCAEIDSNCIILILKSNNNSFSNSFVCDLIECLGINAINKGKF